MDLLSSVDGCKWSVYRRTLPLYPSPPSVPYPASPRPPYPPLCATQGEISTQELDHVTFGTDCNLPRNLPIMQTRETSPCNLPFI